jgi:hypothetical protein
MKMDASLSSVNDKVDFLKDDLQKAIEDVKNTMSQGTYEMVLAFGTSAGESFDMEGNIPVGHGDNLHEICEALQPLKELAEILTNESSGDEDPDRSSNEAALRSKLDGIVLTAESLIKTAKSVAAGTGPADPMAEQKVASVLSEVNAVIAAAGTGPANPVVEQKVAILSEVDDMTLEVPMQVVPVPPPIQVAAAEDTHKEDGEASTLANTEASTTSTDSEKLQKPRDYSIPSPFMTKLQKQLPGLRKNATQLALKKFRYNPSPRSRGSSVSLDKETKVHSILQVLLVVCLFVLHFLLNVPTN